jgi:hypothetical protein
MAELSQDDHIEKVCDTIQAGTSTYKEINSILKQIEQRDRPKWKTRSPLIEAVKKGDKHLASIVIHSFGFDVHSTTEDWNGGEWCALAAAIHRGAFPLAKYLVEKKSIDVTFKTKILRDAIYFRNVDSVKYLLKELETPVNAKMWYSDENSTKSFLPLHFAISVDANK